MYHLVKTENDFGEEYQLFSEFDNKTTLYRVLIEFKMFGSVFPKKPSYARCYINEGKLIAEPFRGLDYTIYPIEESGSLNDFLTDLSKRYNIHSEVLLSTSDEQEMVKFIEDIVFLEELKK